MQRVISISKRLIECVRAVTYEIIKSDANSVFATAQSVMSNRVLDVSALQGDLHHSWAMIVSRTQRHAGSVP